MLLNLQRIKFKIFSLVLLFSISLISCRTKKDNATNLTSAKTNEITEKYAKILATHSGNIKNMKLYTFIDEWYGTPYQFGGTDKNGIDCSGFVFKLYEHVYTKKTPRTTSELLESSNEINKSVLKEGDFVFFKIESKKVSHVGVYLMNNKFVHASSKKGIMISDLNEEFFVKCYYKGGRLK